MRSSFLNSLKRYRSIDTLIIILADLALIPLGWLLLQLFIAWLSKINFLLSSVVLDKTSLIQNTELASYNAELLRLAGINTSYLTLVILVLFSLGWSLLTYLQWARILKKPYSLASGAIFTLSYASWMTLMIVFVSTFLLFFIEPDFMNPFLIFWLVAFFIFSFAQNFGLFETKKKSTQQTYWNYLKYHCRTSYHHGFDNLLKILSGLVFLIVLSFILLIAAAIIAGLGFLLSWTYLVLFLLSLPLWRYFMAEWITQLAEPKKPRSSPRHKKKRRR